MEKNEPVKRSKISILINEEYNMEFTSPKTETEVQDFIKKQHSWLKWKPISEISDEDGQFNILLGVDVARIIADQLTLDSYKENAEKSTVAVSKDNALIVSELMAALTENQNLKTQLSNIKFEMLNEMKKKIDVYEAEIAKLMEKHEEELENTKKLADDTVAEFEKKYKEFADKAVDSIGIVKSISLIEYMQRIDELQQNLIRTMENNMGLEKKNLDLATKLTENENQVEILKNAIFAYMKQVQPLASGHILRTYVDNCYKNHINLYPGCVKSGKMDTSEKLQHFEKCETGDGREVMRKLGKVWDLLGEQLKKNLVEPIITDKNIFDILIDAIVGYHKYTTLPVDGPKVKAIFNSDMIFFSDLFSNTSYYKK